MANKKSILSDSSNGRRRGLSGGEEGK